MDGRNSKLFQDFYELAAKQFNDGEWIPDSLVLPDLHEDYARSKPLPLNVAPITADQFKMKLNDNRYKMVKVIADWERSGAGAGMINNVIEGDDEEKDDDTTETQCNMQRQHRMKHNNMNSSMEMIGSLSSEKGHLTYCICGIYLIIMVF